MNVKKTLDLGIVGCVWVRIQKVELHYRWKYGDEKNNN